MNAKTKPIQYLLVVLILLPVNLIAKTVKIEPYCKKEPIGKGISNALIGNFEIIGKDKTGSAYSGKLSVSRSEKTYNLEKIVSNKKHWEKRGLKNAAQINLCAS